MERLYKRKIRRYPLCLTRRCRGALSLRARERGSLALTRAVANKKAVSHKGYRFLKSWFQPQFYSAQAVWSALHSVVGHCDNLS